MTDDVTQPIETPTAEPAPTAAAEEAVPPAPVSAPTATVAAPGSNRTRWAIGLGVAGVAVAGVVGAAVLLGSPATPAALQYVPGDAPVVIEVRLDLPGDQLQNVGNLLAHFPGFADQSTLTEKVDTALSRMVEAASDGKATYEADLKPWVNGPLFIGLLKSADGLVHEGAEDVIVSATTNGAAACDAAFKDQAVTRETYRNLDLVLSARGDMACVLDGRQALLGAPASVKQALDAKAAGTGMDKSERYRQARAALGGDRLATMFADGDSLRQLMPTPDDGPITGLGGITGALPDWMMGGVRAEADALVVDFLTGPMPTSTAGPSLLPAPAGHASLIAPMLPADTLGFVEIQGAGVGIQNLLTQLGSTPELATQLQMLEGLGGAGELVGWITDAGVAVSMDDTSPEVALVLIATDETKASTTVASLRGLLGFAGLGDGIQVSESTVNGVAVTTVTITDLGSVVPPGSVPGLGELPASGPVSFSIAARGRAVVLTFGEDAMSAILNVGAGTSLVDQAAFKQAAARGLTNSQATLYLAAGATMDLVEGFLPADELAMFQAEAAPYLDPVEAVLFSATSDAGGARSRLVITVTKP